jgi:hypothetical protein
VLSPLSVKDERRHGRRIKRRERKKGQPKRRGGREVINRDWSEHLLGQAPERPGLCCITFQSPFPLRIQLWIWGLLALLNTTAPGPLHSLDICSAAGLFVNALFPLVFLQVTSK